jgi:hypothetical protein
VSFTGAQRFTIRGQLDDRPVEVSYDAGRLRGDDDAVRRIEELLADRSTLRLSARDDDHPATADDPAAVMAAAQEVLAIEAVEGDYPIPEADDAAG